MNVLFDSADLLRGLTERPGVYRMYDQKQKVIYVGKANNLKKRVASYFQRTAQSAKTEAMMRQVVSVEVTVTNTETEALLLEYNLIKRHKPYFNVVLRDDKSYPYIYISTEQAFPRLKFHRGPRKGKGRYFGPYPSTAAVRETLNELQKLFQIRQCDDTFFSNRTRPCLQYQIKRCTGPCVDLITTERYAEDVREAILFLEGRNRIVINALITRMENAAEAREYEQAARFRDQIAQLKEIEARQLVAKAGRLDLDVLALASDGSIHCITVLFIRNGAVIGSRNHFPRRSGETDRATILNAFVAQYYLGREAPREILLEESIEDLALLETELKTRNEHPVAIRYRVRGDRLRWLKLARTNANSGLQLQAASNATLRRQLQAIADILQLDEPPARMECFDVSHTSGEATVASCVVFNAAGPLKSDYRRFNLHPAAAGDDYAAMEEAIRRRYERIRKGEVALPDVLFIDGGRGQLARVLTVLDELDIGWLKVVGVAKGRARKAGAEQFWIAGDDRPLMVPPDSPARLLIQQIRDEAHRFAIGGHRQRRAKVRKVSRLEQIPGLGPKKRRELLRQFGGLQGVMGAGIDDLLKVHGVGRELAETIYNDLHLQGRN